MKPHSFGNEKESRLVVDVAAHFFFSFTSFAFLFQRGKHTHAHTNTEKKVKNR